MDLEYRVFVIVPGVVFVHKDPVPDDHHGGDGGGRLPPMTLSTVPPVFGLGGYGPADEG